MDLEGKNILVTGGGSGYGKGIASVLVKAGANVWITGRNTAKLQAAAFIIGAKAVPVDASSARPSSPSPASGAADPRRAGGNHRHGGGAVLQV